MPLYEFRCNKCKHEYEELATAWHENGEYPEISCPKCNSVEKHKLNSAPAQPVNKESHDYKFKEMQPKLRDQRAAIEATSHVGPQPYTSIDDISSGNNFNPSNWEKDGDYKGIS